VVLPSALLLAVLLPWLWRTAFAGRDDRRGSQVKLQGWLRRTVNAGHDDRESGYSRQRLRLLGLVVIVVPTLFANAFLTAVLSSSDSRYQARVIWLVPLLAALVALDLLGQRGPATRPPSNSKMAHYCSSY
jgi:hypothetical protein